MLPAVDFDHKARIMAYKIDDIRTDGRLTAKACAYKPVTTHRVPDQPLCIGHVAPQSTRAYPLLR
jgi:hypothetical protein